MTALECTLLTDGSSDRALAPILEWLLRQNGAYPSRKIEWYDPSIYRRPPTTLWGRIDHAFEQFPCDLLFVHRDAEAEPYEAREKEIREAIATSSITRSRPIPAVLVIPIRMMEAWLLFEEQCIRQAAGCPRGKVPLGLPKLTMTESLTDPKTLLHQSLRIASERQGRHLKRFNVEAAIHRLAELVPDYGPLRKLSAFEMLEHELCKVLFENNWASGGKAPSR